MLAWGSKFNTPEWLSKGNFTENQLLEILENHISTVMNRYQGKIQEYSVVNEILGTPWASGNRFWYDHLDKKLDWVKKCFTWASQADSSAKLLLNDFGIEIPNTRMYYDDRNNFIYNLTREMKDSGVPVDGVAFQMHEYGADFYPETKIPALMEMLDKNIQKFRELGVDVYVTEIDLRLDGLQGTKEQKWELQAKIYGKILDTCLNAGVKSFIIFSITDKLSWFENPGSVAYVGPDVDPCPWDENFQPKPAYFAMMDVMKKHYQQRHS